MMIKDAYLVLGEDADMRNVLREKAPPSVRRHEVPVVGNVPVRLIAWRRNRGMRRDDSRVSIVQCKCCWLKLESAKRTRTRTTDYTGTSETSENAKSTDEDTCRNHRNNGVVLSDTHIRAF